MSYLLIAAYVGVVLAVLIIGTCIAADAIRQAIREYTLYSAPDWSDIAWSVITACLGLMLICLGLGMIAAPGGKPAASTAETSASTGGVGR